MNKQRIEQCIELMRKAERLDMNSYQRKSHGKTANTIEELHTCGNSACFAGYLALAPFFREAGGELWYDEPKFEDSYGPIAVAEFLDISQGLAYAIVYGDYYGEKEDDEGVDLFPNGWEAATPADVIAVLERILAGELK